MTSLQTRRVALGLHECKCRVSMRMIQALNFKKHYPPRHRVFGKQSGDGGASGQDQDNSSKFTASGQMTAGAGEQQDSRRTVNFVTAVM
mmetsp:Transcript_11109/g.21445  ORF Transcript_11109/g.21445 Transcript_11109/m.21445 type:complete len:89 (+) Transcript_11109:40-306(+)